jgi:hypothetical protein
MNLAISNIPFIKIPLVYHVLLVSLVVTTMFFFSVSQGVPLALWASTQVSPPSREKKVLVSSGSNLGHEGGPKR